jgi:hypothetical protein
MFTSRTVAYLGSQAAEVALLVQALREILVGLRYAIGRRDLPTAVPVEQPAA